MAKRMPGSTLKRRATGQRNGSGGASYVRILSEARRLFARHGYDGTSIRDITTAAEVNVGAVTYHFGAKQDLYYQVLTDITGPLLREIELTAADSKPPLQRIERMVREFFRYNQAHPELVPLIVREMASDQQLAPPVAAMVGRAIPTLAAVIAEGQQGGTICRGDPLLLALSSLAQPVYLNLARKGIARAAGLDPNDPAVFDRVVDHCVTVLRAALEVRP